MIKKIVFLAIPIIFFAGAGLITVKNYFSSFPSSNAVTRKFSSSGNLPTAIDLTESFFDDSGSMRGYHSDRYVQFLRTLKSHIREKGKYRYYAFSDTENVIDGDVWEVIESDRFYHRNDTYFDKVLDSIGRRVRSPHGTAKNFIIVTDGIQDVSGIQDYSRIVNKVSDLLDTGLFFQIVAIKLPFKGYKYPEGGGFIPYEGPSPLFCYIFTFQNDFGRDLYNKVAALGVPVEFLGFGNRNIHARVSQFSTTAKNRDGSKNTFKRFKDEIPVTFLVSESGVGGTLVTNIALSQKGVNIDSSAFRRKTPEFCGTCTPIYERRNEKRDFSRSTASVTVTTTDVMPASNADSSLVIEYSLFFRDWNKDAETVACDLTLCNWLPLNPPDWVYAWSSDCDDSKYCFEGRTPFLINLINPLLHKSMRKYTFGYAVIRN